MKSLQDQGFELDNAIEFGNCGDEASSVLEERRMAEAGPPRSLAEFQ